MSHNKPFSLVNRIKALQQLGLDDNAVPRSLAEIAAFVGSDRTAPYQWVSGRSRPARRALVWLAFFEVTKGDKAKVSHWATDDKKDEVIARTKQWFDDAGYPETDVDALVAEEILRLELSTRQDKLALTADKEPYDADFIKVAADYNENLNSGVRRLTQRVRWKLLMNRLSQQEASEDVSNWHKLCEEGRVASVEVDTVSELRSRLNDVAHFIEQLTSSKHCTGFDRFVVPLDPRESNEMTQFVIDLKKSVENLNKQRVITYIWTGANAPSVSPSAVWAFHDIRESNQFGRLIIPSAFDPEIRDVLRVLNKRLAELDTDYNELLWGLHSTPLSWGMALEFLKSRAIHYEDGKFKPLRPPENGVNKESQKASEEVDNWKQLM